jgi:hypothetical protein
MNRPRPSAPVRDDAPRCIRLEPRDALAALLLAALAFIVFNANLRAIPAADTFAARYLPFSILRHHSVLLDPVAEPVAQGRLPPAAQGQDGSAFWLQRGRSGQLISKYPLVVPLLVTPLYIPAAHYLDTIGWDPHAVDQVARVMEKLSASLIAATSVGLMYLLLRRRAGPALAAGLTLAYAFGTTTWVISSQALWTHGMAQLLIVATLLLITGPPTALRAVAAGLACALIAANRPPDAVLAAALGAFGLLWAGRRWPLLVLAGIVPAALTLAYNLGTVGHWAGAYALAVHPSDLNDDIPGGIAGLLFSPTRGLFVFSPFLLFVPALLVHALRERSTRALTAALAAAMVVQVVGYAMVDWRQGIAWGPRWLTDMVPILVWMLPPVVSRLALAGRALFITACLVSVVIQAIGAFWYTGASDTALLTAKTADRMQPMWALRHAAFLAELDHPRAPADLLVRLRGSIDLVVPAAGPHGERQLDVAGWALADARTPHDVAVLIDGRLLAGTSEFFERPDVVQALGEKSPAGWRLRVDARDLAPGPHQIAVLVRAAAGGDVRLLRQRTFTLDDAAHDSAGADALQQAARVAVERIATAQQPAGYWLTRFTAGTRFDAPQPEFNTYLSALMLDVAGPIARARGMEPMLARARSHLTHQIETNGLVRYHGRPDTPSIGVLGCVITPDADDTALGWRTAPGTDPAQLASALRILARYRTADGLYRTWLAPRADYQCLDPGADPNPADIGIQMHIYLFLARHDRRAAADLCQALQRHAGDSRTWVYYAVAPPVLILRQAELRRAGCTVDLPAARLASPVRGQDTWVRAATVLTQLEDAAAPAPAVAEEARKLLHAIAWDGFALVRTDPPLLYHNDLSATVRRYYWSPEVGYALWLRLVDAADRRAPKVTERAR